MKNQEDEIKKLVSLLDVSQDVPIDQLPVPSDVSSKIAEAIQNSQVDNKIYEYKDLAEKIKRMPKIPKITSGFKEIDELVEGGWQPGELIILSAAEKHGKSLICQSMTIEQASNGIPVLWFTLEMGWNPITRRFMKMDWEYLTMDNPSKLSIFYPIDNRAVSLKWIRSQISISKKEHGIKMVYIDHLHYLFPMSEGRNGNISFLVGEVVKDVQNIAKDLEVTICLICHMTKTDPGIMPDKDKIRDSSFICQFADHTLILWRESQKKDKGRDILDNPYLYTNRSILSFELNRRTGETRRMGIGMINGRFYSWNEYENLMRTQGEKRKNGEELVEVSDEVDKIFK